MKITFLLFLSFTLIACGKSKSTDDSARPRKVADVVDVEGILKNKGLHDIQRAEELAKQGEKLFHPVGFIYAKEIFDRALEFDPDNKKANFYSALLGPIVHKKGIFKRIAPLIRKSKDSDKREIERIRKDMKKNPHVEKFFFEGPEDIATVLDLQKFFRESIDEYEKVRQFFKKNKDFTLKLTLNKWEPKSLNDCIVKKVGTSKITQECPNMTRRTGFVNRADLEVFQYLFAGLEIYLSIITAYDGTGMLEVHKAHANRRVTDQVRHEILSQEPNFGNLLSENKLAMLPDLGSDIFAGFKWFAKINKNLCRKDQNGQRVKRKGFLIEDPICLEDASPESEVDKLLEIVELAVKGVPQEMEIKGSGGKVLAKARINPLAPFYKPVQNVKQIMPNRFDECGRGIGYKDPTVGGIFPDGDGDEVVQKLIENKECKR